MDDAPLTDLEISRIRLRSATGYAGCAPAAIVADLCRLLREVERQRGVAPVVSQPPSASEARRRRRTLGYGTAAEGPHAPTRRSA